LSLRLVDTEFFWVFETATKDFSRVRPTPEELQPTKIHQGTASGSTAHPTFGGGARNLFLVCSFFGFYTTLLLHQFPNALVLMKEPVKQSKCAKVAWVATIASYWQKVGVTPNKPPAKKLLSSTPELSAMEIQDDTITTDVSVAKVQGITTTSDFPVETLEGLPPLSLSTEAGEKNNKHGGFTEVGPRKTMKHAAGTSLNFATPLKNYQLGPAKSSVKNWTDNAVIIKANSFRISGFPALCPMEFQLKAMEEMMRTHFDRVNQSCIWANCMHTHFVEGQGNVISHLRLADDDDTLNCSFAIPIVNNKFCLITVSKITISFHVKTRRSFPMNYDQEHPP
jgi:hypothetical protein